MTASDVSIQSSNEPSKLEVFRPRMSEVGMPSLPPLPGLPPTTHTPGACGNANVMHAHLLDQPGARSTFIKVENNSHSKIMQLSNSRKNHLTWHRTAQAHLRPPLLLTKVSMLQLYLSFTLLTNVKTNPG